MRVTVASKTIGFEAPLKAGSEKKTSAVLNSAPPNYNGVALGNAEKELALGGQLSVIKFVDALVEGAQEMRASDIHVEPRSEKVQIRFRVDGVLKDIFCLPKNIYEGVVSRVKILAGLRTDEHQAAQDGRFRNTMANEATIDVRVSVAPAYYGENIVLRLLSDKAEDYTLASLGFSEENAKKIMRAVRRPYGIILATGPTGSGKTTTLYTMLKDLNTKDVAIVTIEDPIEYAIDGIEQIQVNPARGLNFANGLRSILRQDPNIIMVGEIRDAETAAIAVNTALTGHLILSTLHTNDAATTMPRLLDMKIESYLIASTINIAIAQRLVRKICEYCKTAKNITPSEIQSLSAIISPKVLAKHKFFYQGSGCEHCGNTGYMGRIGIHEVLVPDAEIREAVLRKAQSGEIRKLAIDRGMMTMAADGFEKVKAGITSIEEILRMLYE